MRSTEDSTPTLQLLTPEGEYRPTPEAEAYTAVIDRLDDALLLRFYRDMVVARRIDQTGANLQRQGELALWIPSHGQEAAQVGSAHACRPQDHIFPAYREHIVGMIRGLDPVDILRVLRGHSLGGWDPDLTGNFHLYTLVLATQTLHATGYAMGIRFDGACGSGDPDRDTAVLVYYGDGATSEGDANEALVFAASYDTPEVFFIQNNHWAISVPVARQSRVSFARRGDGFGIPSARIDGNDVLISYAVTFDAMERARAGEGPSLIEALTYRMGAHTTADDPTKYRPAHELATWEARDPIPRYRTWLTHRGVSEAAFAEVDIEAEDASADLRAGLLSLEPPTRSVMFASVYRDPHPRMVEQSAWLEAYEQSFDGGAA